MGFFPVDEEALRYLRNTGRPAELVDLVNLLPFGEAEARATAELRAALEKLGKPIGPIDTLIAGTAIANRALLVTHNTSEFSRVSGLKVVDWY